MRTYLRVIGYGKPYFFYAGLAIIALIFYTIFNTATLLAIIPFLETLFSNTADMVQGPEPELVLTDTQSLKAYAYYKLNGAILNYGTWNMLLFICIGLVTVNFLKNAFRYLASWSIAPFEYGILENIRNHIFQHLNT